MTNDLVYLLLTAAGACKCCVDGRQARRASQSQQRAVGLMVKNGGVQRRLADRESPDGKIIWIIDYHHFSLFRSSTPPMKTSLETLRILQARPPPQRDRSLPPRCACTPFSSYTDRPQAVAVVLTACACAQPARSSQRTRSISAPIQPRSRLPIGPLDCR